MRWQRSLSLGSSEDKRPKFAHPAEEDFARILDFYGIEWVYEPRTFPLNWDKQGNVVQAFTPDFYLPQQDLYIELTTLRPHLARYKNRRLRRMKELYPEITVKLFKRGTMRDLMTKYGLEKAARGIRGTGAQKKRT
jgi:hypoxanthine phosphoribosyltransferase